MHMQDVEEPEARAAFIWILGEHGQGIQVRLLQSAKQLSSSCTAELFAATVCHAFAPCRPALVPAKVKPIGDHQIAYAVQKVLALMGTSTIMLMVMTVSITLTMLAMQDDQQQW
jgi:hypothetical protein